MTEDQIIFKNNLPIIGDVSKLYSKLFLFSVGLGDIGMGLGSNGAPLTNISELASKWILAILEF